MDSSRGACPRIHPYFISSVINRVNTRYMSPHNMQFNVSHLSAEMNPNSRMPLAISAYNMEVNRGSHSMFAQNNMSMSNRHGILCFPSCVLHPPIYKPKKPETDPSCKSVFVSFMVKNITEEIIREILGSCGEIDNMEVLDHDNSFSCYVRFIGMGSADQAINLSNYTVKIYNKDDSKNSGKMYVYYSKDRDSPVNETKIGEHQKQEFVNLQFSELKALIDMLKNEETFKDAFSHLTAKFYQGECSTITSDYFMEMIQSVQNHAKRLINEKNELFEELRRAEVKLKENIVGISLQFNDLIDFYNLLELSNYWSNFNVNKNQINKVKEGTVSFDEIFGNQVCKNSGEYSNLNNNENNFVKTTISSSHPEIITKDLEKLKKESRAIQDKLQISLKESAAFIKTREENDHKHCECDSHCSECIKKLEIIQDILAKLSQEEKKKYIAYLYQKKVCKNQDAKKYLEQDKQRSHLLNGVLSHHDLHLICSIAIFFSVHKTGISVDYIHSYLMEFFPEIKLAEVEDLMYRFPNIFKRKTSGVGASLTKEWHFCKLEKN